MDSIRIKNLHCLADTGEIPFKSINILVGANSSGKSSFLRTFPLLKQGLNINKRGPVLWQSEDVDFGSFGTSVRKGEKNIEFHYRIDNYLLCLNIVENNNGIDYINQITIDFLDQKIQININTKNEFENIVINDEVFTKDYKIKIIDGRTDIIPVFLIEDYDDKLGVFKHTKGANTLMKDSEVITYIRKLLKDKISIQTVSGINKLIGFPLCKRIDFLSKIQKIESPKKWNTLVSGWNLETSEFNKLNNRLLLAVSLRLVEYLNNKLTGFYRNSSYIGPLRATAQRYYRRQNLSLDSIDSQGLNLPMFVNDLGDREKKDLKDWLLKNFEFYLSTDFSGGHIAMSLINENTNEKFNLADSGFGFSQILPIIIVLWTISATKRNSRKQMGYYNVNNEIYYAIEQPELHLHPSMQAKLADVFISAINTAKENNVNLKLVIETHSETIINRIGQRISEKKISKSDVTVSLFQNKPNKSGNNVVQAAFNEEGFLENWPVGFFNAI
jgi:AAA15 family ATPase/GTPase